MTCTHNRDSDVKRTLVNELHPVNNSTSETVFKDSRNRFYDNGNDSLSDSVRFLLHNMSNDNFMILQNLLYVDFLTLYIL